MNMVMGVVKKWMEAPPPPPPKKACRTPNLPFHLQMEILSRLPIKTLVSCTCVCKSWLKFIFFDSPFAKLHLQRSPSELFFHSFFAHGNATRFYLGHILFDSGNSSPNLNLTRLNDFHMFSMKGDNCIEFGKNTDKSYLQFVNSCNGLVCFFGDTMFAVISNPITSEFIIVPAPQRGTDCRQIVTYGLGFSAKANRYKLLRVMTRREIDSLTLKVRTKRFVEICTLEDGSSWRSWRNVGDFPYPVSKLTSSNPVFLRGKLHFQCSLSRRPHTAICCFDFDDELLEEVPLPPDRIYHNGTSIGVLGGCLFLSHYRPGPDNCIDIWVMKKYGVNDSWTKAFSVPKYTPPEPSTEKHQPIQLLDIGEILMLHQKDELVLHNPVTNSIRAIGPIELLNVHAFSPTFLLLKDALMGYNGNVYNAYSRDAEWEREELDEASFWKSVEKNYVQKSPLTDDVAVAGDERNAHVSPTSEFSDSSTALLAHEQGTDVLTSDEFHDCITGEERHGCVSGTGLIQTPASSSATHVTAEVRCGKMKALVDNLEEELKKERQQRKELEQRLQNEVAKAEPLKEQTEHLKQQIQQLEQILQNEQAVEQLKEQIQQSEEFKQANQQMMGEMS